MAALSAPSESPSAELSAPAAVPAFGDQVSRFSSQFQEASDSLDAVGAASGGSELVQVAQEYRANVIDVRAQSCPAAQDLVASVAPGFASSGDGDKEFEGVSTQPQAAPEFASSGDGDKEFEGISTEPHSAPEFASSGDGDEKFEGISTDASALDVTTDIPTDMPAGDGDGSAAA